MDVETEVQLTNKEYAHASMVVYMHAPTTPNPQASAFKVDTPCHVKMVSIPYKKAVEVRHGQVQPCRKESGSGSRENLAMQHDMQTVYLSGIP